MDATEDFRTVVLDRREDIDGLGRFEHCAESILHIVADDLCSGTLVRRLGRLPR